MGKFIDLKGQKFGKLKVCYLGCKPNTTKSKEKFWVCECECGNQVTVSGYLLRSGQTKSCGCITKNRMAKIATETPWKKHGMSSTRLYKIYYAMRDRCYNIHKCNYDKYGGRGITVCQEWLDDFMNFYNWSIENGYSDELSIDRINVDGNYEPSNCRWECATIQQFNRGKQSNNSTGYIGVSKVKSGNYRAYIKKNGKQITLGTFETIEEAIEARKIAESKYY